MSDQERQWCKGQVWNWLKTYFQHDVYPLLMIGVNDLNSVNQISVIGVDGLNPPDTVAVLREALAIAERRAAAAGNGSGPPTKGGDS